MTSAKPAEDFLRGSPRHEAIIRAFTLAGVDPSAVSAEGVVIHRNHIEYDEVQLDRLGIAHIDWRRGEIVTKRRVVRNPNPRLAVTR